MKKKNTNKDIPEQQELFPSPKQLLLPLLTLKEHLIENGFEENMIIDLSMRSDSGFPFSTPADRITDSFEQYQAGREMMYAN